MHTITWSDGSVNQAQTWQEMLDLIRDAQWHRMSEEGFRSEMTKRAWYWSGTEIDMGAAPARFFRELERAKLIRIGEK